MPALPAEQLRPQTRDDGAGRRRQLEAGRLSRLRRQTAPSQLPMNRYPGELRAANEDVEERSSGANVIQMNARRSRLESNRMQTLRAQATLPAPAQAQPAEQPEAAPEPEEEGGLNLPTGPAPAKGGGAEPSMNIAEAIARAKKALPQAELTVKARLSMWSSTLGCYLLNLPLTIVILIHKVTSDRFINKAAEAFRGVARSGGQFKAPDLVQWILSRDNVILKAEWAVAVLLLILQAVVYVAAFVTLVLFLVCNPLNPAALTYCLIKEAKSTLGL